MRLIPKQKSEDELSPKEKERLEKIKKRSAIFWDKLFTKLHIYDFIEKMQNQLEKNPKRFVKVYLIILTLLILLPFLNIYFSYRHDKIKEVNEFYEEKVYSKQVKRVKGEVDVNDFMRFIIYDKMQLYRHKEDSIMAKKVKTRMDSVRINSLRLYKTRMKELLNNINNE